MTPEQADQLIARLDDIRILLFFLLLALTTMIVLALYAIASNTARE